MELIKVLLFAGAVSLDGFLAGVACGVRMIRIPAVSELVVAAAAGASVLVSMLCGRALGRLFTGPAAGRLGVLLLFGMALFFLLQGFREHLCGKQQNRKEPLVAICIRPLGVMIQVLRSPETADQDASGEISWREALALALALSLDSFGAGIGIALNAFPVWLTVLSAAGMNLLAVKVGVQLGQHIGKKTDNGMTAFLSGGVFLLLAAVQLF